MKTYCLKCKKDLKTLKFLEQKITDYLLNRNLMIVKEKSRFIKEQEAEDLLSNLGIRTSLNKILILGDILF